MSAMRNLLERSVAVGTEVSALDGEELVLWRTDKGLEFTTSYADAAHYGGGATDDRS